MTGRPGINDWISFAFSSACTVQDIIAVCTCPTTELVYQFYLVASVTNSAWPIRDTLTKTYSSARIARTLANSRHTIHVLQRGYA